MVRTTNGWPACGLLACPTAALLFFLAPALALPLSAQAPPDARLVPRLGSPITLDGRVDEPAWDAVPALPATGHVPNLGAEPSEPTEFRVAHDDDYIYFSCRNWDSDPAGIQGPTLLRDASSFSNDWCVLQLDTFNDEETTLGFGTTPSGIRTDVVFPNDGNAPPSFTWNTFWHVAVHRDDRGWYAEGRIPLSSLRFQDGDGDGVVVMGLSMWRVIARKSEFITYPRIDNRWGDLSIVKASQFADAAFRGIEPTRPVYVTPYALGAAGRAWELNPAETGYDPADRRDFDIGGDLKYALASNVTLDVTVNTDFAQAEADDQQVNLTRFSLFFPEKRLFFLERNETFTFPLGGAERLFHSRRVGLVGGEPVPILAGARVVGRVGEWDFGVLDMQTGETAFSPSENLGVARFRRRVLNPNSYVGGIVTTRFAEGGRGSNVLYGLDGIFRLFGQDYLTVNVAQSFDDDGAPLDPDAQPVPEVAPHQRALARVHWERRGVDGLTYTAELARAGDTFEPGLGFIFRRDYTRAAGDIGYGWRPGEASPLLRYGIEGRGSVFTRNSDGSVETVELAGSANLDLKRGDAFTAELVGTYEDLRTGFDLADDAVVPPGEYRFVAAELGYTASSARLLRANASLTAGQYFDGRIVSGSISPIWLPSNHLELGGTYQLNRITFPDRDQAFTAHIARIKARIMVSAKVSGAAFVQYNSAIDRTSGNVRFRYNPSEGHDLYIVWNERLLVDRSRYDPLPPLSENRTLIIKYARTFTFGG